MSASSLYNEQERAARADVLDVFANPATAELIQKTATAAKERRAKVVTRVRIPAYKPSSIQGP